MAGLTLDKIKANELKSLDTAALAGAASGIRKEMVDLKMDIVADQAVKSGKNRNLKKSLARVLTEQSARRIAASK